MAALRNMTALRMYELDQGSVIPIIKDNTVWVTFTLTFSTIGMVLSTLALLLLILTAVFFVEWRRSYKNQLLIQFMLARFFYTFVRYFIDIQNTFDVVLDLEHIETLDVLLLIYSEMALVSWMFIFSRQMYLSLVKVFDPENLRVWKVSLCAWTIPAVISFLLYLLYYARHTNDAIDFVIYIIIVKWPILLVNGVLLILVLKSVIKSNSSKTKSNVKIVVVMMIMIFMFCFQQMFIDIYKIIYFVNDSLSIIGKTLLTSNILTMYHCAFSIMFWVFGNVNTRKLWQCQRKGLHNKAALNVRFSA